MQLQRLNTHLKPLTLAASLISATAAFAYSNIDTHSEISATSRSIANYINTVDKDDNAFLSSKFKFQLYLQKWEEKTMFFSSAYAIVEDNDFKAIVAMGQQAVPFIKEELENKPSTLVWALNYIFGHKISDKPNLTITDACKLWIKAI